MDSISSPISPLRIGNLVLKNPLVLAPMAGFTDLPLRLLCRRFGASLAFTEMISAAGLIHNSQKTFEMMQSREDDRPLGMQLFGSDPGILAEAAHICEEQGADLLDLNCGCPVRKVIKQYAGSALMGDTNRLVEIIHAMVEAVKIPVTIKIRSGRDDDSINILEIAEKIKHINIAAITLHPRTAAIPYSSKPRWDLIKELKSVVPFPVLGSGGLMTDRDVKELFQSTGADGAMLARGALGHPWLFETSLQRLQGETAISEPSFAQRLEVMKEHLSMMIPIYGEEKACRLFRAHSNYYVSGWPDATTLRNKLNQVSLYPDFCSIADQYLLSIQNHNNLSIED